MPSPPPSAIPLESLRCSTVSDINDNATVAAVLERARRRDAQKRMDLAALSTTNVFSKLPSSELSPKAQEKKQRSRERIIEEKKLKMEEQRAASDVKKNRMPATELLYPRTVQGLQPTVDVTLVPVVSRGAAPDHLVEFIRSEKIKNQTRLFEGVGFLDTQGVVVGAPVFADDHLFHPLAMQLEFRRAPGPQRSLFELRDEENKRIRRAQLTQPTHNGAPTEREMDHAEGFMDDE